MGRFGLHEYPNKCFVCGEGHKHRGKNKYRELCKPCATKFMLKGRFLKMKLWCFASLNCPENYTCPLTEKCREENFKDIQSIPVLVVKMFHEKKGSRAWRSKVK